MDGPKTKRGSNYTAQEINKLLDLVTQHRSAVEDKRTGTIYLTRKKEAWENICTGYNAVATSGVRTVEQLKVFYDNKKQKARKSLAQHNKNEYLTIKNNVDIAALHNVTEEEVKIALDHAKTDKGEWNKTGGGTWCPTVSDSDQKILALIKYQVTPLPNSCDSAAVYFGDSIEELPIAVEEYIMIPNAMDIDSQTILEQDVIINSKDQKNVNKCSQILENVENISKKRILPKIKENCKVTMTPRKKTNKRGINYKQLYFKRKSQNAFLEKRRIYQEIRLRQQEHAMFIKEHKLKLEIMKAEHEYRISNKDL